MTLSDGTKNATWTSIGDYKNPQSGVQSFATPTSSKRVANYEDFSSLAPPKATDDGFNIKTGVGVLYGDGATETLNTVNEAFGYKSGGNSSYGMRGVFVYDNTNGKNLFFPIGSSGYGHRKNSLSNGKNTYRGVLRYNSNSRWGYFNAVSASSYVNGVYDAPLFFDVFRSEGACYWYGVGGPKRDGYDECAWDMNYTTFDFSSITDTNLGTGADACFVRCIAK